VICIVGDGRQKINSRTVIAAMGAHQDGIANVRFSPAFLDPGGFADEVFDLVA
jgi:hypothetical protein